MTSIKNVAVHNDNNYVFTQEKLFQSNLCHLTIVPLYYLIYLNSLRKRDKMLGKPHIFSFSQLI